MGRNILQAVITGGKDQFGAWIEGMPGVYGAGDTVDEVKQSLLEGLKLYIEENNEMAEVLKRKYDIAFTFDTSGYLKYISGYINFAGLHKITGVSQKQLWSYANGYRNPSHKTVGKILSGIRMFGNDISQVQLRL